MNRKSRPSGRPKLPEKERRAKAVSFKTTVLEYETIVQKSRSAGMSPGVYCRDAALSRTVRPRLTPGENALYRALGAEIRYLGINLNTVAKKANSGFQRDYAKDVENVMAELKRILNKFKEKLL